MKTKAILVVVLVVLVGIAGLALFLSGGGGHTVFVPDEAVRLKDQGEFLLNKRHHTTDRQQKAELLSQAIEKFKQALAIKPDFAVVHNLLGHAYTEKGQWESAQKHLEKALRLRPDYPAARYNRGQVYQRLSVGRRDNSLLDRAIEDYEAALQSELAAAFSGDILKAMAEAYNLKGDYDRAIETLREYLRRSPHAPDWALVDRKIRGLELMKESLSRRSSPDGGQTTD